MSRDPCFYSQSHKFILFMTSWNLIVEKNDIISSVFQILQKKFQRITFTNRKVLKKLLLLKEELMNFLKLLKYKKMSNKIKKKIRKNQFKFCLSNLQRNYLNFKKLEYNLEQKRKVEYFLGMKWVQVKQFKLLEQHILLKKTGLYQ